MSTIFDYAVEFGDIPFGLKPLNEVDNVIFSRLSYLDLSDFDGKPLREVADTFHYTPDSEANRRNKVMIRTEELLKLIGATQRFGGVTVTDFEEIAGGSYETAFCGVAFRISDELSYISYRGTDEQILSFYEDAELAYSFPVKAQLAALSYTNHIFDTRSGSFYLGGHSKGGNLALFAYIFTKYENRDRIISVYNNDGPGFPKDLVGVLFTPQNSEKIINLAPNGSIVGRMLESGGAYTIVRSAAVGIAQHNVFTWTTNGDEFERADGFNILSEYMEDTLTQSLDTVSREDLKKTVESIYKIAKRGGIKTLDDINMKNSAYILLAILEAARSENNSGEEISGIVRTLAKSMIDSIDISKLLPNIEEASQEENDNM
ncbi:MAG: DUF2974 domain-containing protein [Eubacterium sp.]|nr:DUF2974 domain-containing protein [Eubacterium sp.]